MGGREWQNESAPGYYKPILGAVQCSAFLHIFQPQVGPAYLNSLAKLSLKINCNMGQSLQKCNDSFFKMRIGELTQTNQNK